MTQGQGRLVILNGPPRCGKTIAAEAIALLGKLPARAAAMTSGSPLSDGSPVVIHSSDELKRRTHLVYGLEADLPPDAFEWCKDQPRVEFLGLTPRQAYINCSNMFIAAHGDAVNGTFIAQEMRRHGDAPLVLCGLGYNPEAAPVIKLVGAQNILLIRVHRFDADDNEFQFNDGRGWLDLPGIMTLDIENRGRDDFLVTATAAADLFYRREAISAAALNRRIQRIREAVCFLPDWPPGSMASRAAHGITAGIGHIPQAAGAGMCPAPHPA